MSPLSPERTDLFAQVVKKSAKQAKRSTEL